ncbi:hypothetical protein D3C81_1467740 [compost metagenome]
MRVDRLNVQLRDLKARLVTRVGQGERGVHGVAWGHDIGRELQVRIAERGVRQAEAERVQRFGVLLVIAAVPHVKPLAVVDLGQRVVATVGGRVRVGRVTWVVFDLLVDGHWQLARRVHLAIQDFSQCLAALLPREPGMQRCANLLGPRLHVGHAAAMGDDDGVRVGLGDEFDQLGLLVRQRVAVVGAFPFVLVVGACGDHHCIVAGDILRRSQGRPAHLNACQAAQCRREVALHAAVLKLDVV